MNHEMENVEDNVSSTFSYNQSSKININSKQLQ